MNHPSTFPFIDFQMFKTQALAVITKPADFFRAMPLTGGLKEPFVFVVAVGIIAAVLQAVFAVFISIGTAVATLLFTPVILGIFSFVGAGVAFLIWKMMGSSHNYEVAYRCIAYSFAILPINLILSVIPYAGGVAGTAWGMYLAYVASVEVHRIAAQKAKWVWGILFVVSALMGIQSEVTTRRMENALQQLEQQVGKDGISPEEASRITAEFLQGLKNAAPPDGQ